MRAKRILTSIVAAIAATATIVFAYYTFTVPVEHTMWASYLIGAIVSACVWVAFTILSITGDDPFR